MVSFFSLSAPSNCVSEANALILDVVVLSALIIVLSSFR